MVSTFSYTHVLGFRMITINTEPKRIIMACNRQGKPPPPSSEDGSPRPESLSPAVNKIGSATPPMKRNGRAGTSIRCGCRMRVNINYHSKINAWRITSFEHTHNHAYGSSIVIEPDETKQPEIVPYECSPADVKRAIDSFRSKSKNGTTAVNNENDIAMVLTSLAGNSPSPSTNQLMSNGHSRQQDVHFNSLSLSEQASANNSLPNLRLASVATMLSPRILAEQAKSPIDAPAPEAQPTSLKNESERLPSIHQEIMNRQLPTFKRPRVFVMTSEDRLLRQGHSDPSSPTGGNFNGLKSAPIRDSGSKSMGGNYIPQARRRSINYAQNRSTPDFPNPPQSATTPSSHSLPKLAATAIELDRYAMLHSSVKKVIALACKKREWTEETLGLIGKLRAAFASSEPPKLPLPPKVGHNVYDSTIKRSLELSASESAYPPKKQKLVSGMSISKPEHDPSSIVFRQKSAEGEKPRMPIISDPSLRSNLDQLEERHEKIIRELKQKSPEEEEENSKDSVSKQLELMDRIRLFGDGPLESNASLLEHLWKNRPAKDTAAVPITPPESSPARKPTEDKEQKNENEEHEEVHMIAVDAPSRKRQSSIHMEKQSLAI
jgi:hypothetical protein